MDDPASGMNEREERQESLFEFTHVVGKDVKIKILDNSYIEMHIDKDEEVLYDLHQGDIVEFKKTL